MNHLYNIHHQNDIDQLMDTALTYGWINSKITKRYSIISTYIIVIGILLNSFSCFLSLGQNKIQEIKELPSLPVWIISTNIISSILQLVPTMFKLNKSIDTHSELSEKFKNLAEDIKNIKITTHNKDEYIEAYNKQLHYLIKQTKTSVKVPSINIVAV